MVRDNLNIIPNLYINSPLYYNDDPRPEYDPNINNDSRPRAARPHTVATIQSGILPISDI